ncbi:MAG: NADPH-dependent FMN reductase [Chthoniobacterales bacterium]
MKLVILSGTNRPSSNTRKIVSELDEIYRKLGNPAEVLDLVDLPPEIFNSSSYAKKPAAFARFSDAILAADGVHLVTPEYNGGMPGILKYFIDMLPFPESFENRPIAFTGLAAGMWGALRPVEQLQHIFAYRLAHIFPARVFMPNVNNLLDENGKINDPELHERLRQQAEEFIKFIRRLKTVVE